MNAELRPRVISPPIADPPPAEAACQDVVRSVYEAIDSGRASDAVARYTEDAVFETARGRKLVGTAAIAAAMAAREADTGRVTRHVLTGLRVTATGGAEARLVGTLSVFLLSGPSPDDPELTSALDIGLSLRDGAWRIHRHASTPLADGDAR
ncbi:SgcJ/EcaC family oxidoreductase [Streptomyces griseorubiginosus]|uniref:SgcJ/EcaC family oxidoreductase n=1 Tax=Streptomyces griseorubiginosus TaxID=67304 RepID=UPI0036CDA71E